MSETDSFISEVTEEVRRDRLFGYLRKHAWAVGAALVLIIGGTGVNEWMKSATQAKAQARGDAILAAVRAETPDARIEALRAVDGDAAVLSQFRIAAVQLDEGDRAASAATLDAIAADGTILPIYRDLARLKLVMLQGRDMPNSDRMTILESIVAAGGPFRSLAMEQRAIALLDSGEKAAAIADFLLVYGDTTASQALRQRARQMIVALGGEIPAASAELADG